MTSEERLLPTGYGKLPRRPWLDIVSDRIMDLPTLQRHLAVWRFFKKKIVFTNGCFDLLHRGHITLLAKARDLGDVLIVGLNSDASVRRLKGPQRPILDQQTRALNLASLVFVDAVVIFDQDTPAELIELVQPDVLVKGGDYAEDEIVGADFVRQKGGQVVRIPLVEGQSTSAIIQKIKAQ